jgi:hypothetical protein
LASVRPIPFFDPILRPIKFVGGGVFITSIMGPGIATPEDPPQHAEVWRDDRKEGSNWRKVANITDPFDQTNIFGMAWGATKSKSVFVMVGSAYKPYDASPGPHQIVPIIAASTDGIAWSTTYRGPDGAQVYIAAFDEKTKTFHAQMQAGLHTDVLSSADGFAWSKVAEIAPGAASPLLTQTGTSLIRDSENNIVPNGGIYGWNRGDTWMAPATMSDVYGGPRFISDAGPGQVQIVTATSRASASVPMEHVFAVACNGSAWQAIGFNVSGTQRVIKIAQSTDVGKTWNLVLSQGSPSDAFEGNSISCIMAGRPSA